MTHHSNNTTPFSVGKYLVSVLATLTPTGTYAPSVSIRSGQGRATHDRIFRFVARFATRADAQRYATEQGLHWLRHNAPSPQPVPSV